MLRGFYTAASGMLAQQRRTEMLSNNIANASTPGFKADQASLKAFPELLLQRMESTDGPMKKVPTSSTIGSIHTGVYMEGLSTRFKQGDSRETKLKTDLILVDGNVPQGGAIFFTVEDENGNVKYTRNGNFMQNEAGYLMTSKGQYVLSENGNRIQLQGDQFTVLSNGAVLENGEEVGTIGISFADDTTFLLKEGNGLFAPFEEYELQNANNNPDITFSIKQGFIERSNVDVAASMSEMMVAYRSFEANQKILQAYDRSMEKAANEIGKLR